MYNYIVLFLLLLKFILTHLLGILYYMMEHVDVSQLFQNKKYLKMCAPMVRYSKLPFRNLVRKYSCDVCFTPMIMANSFVRSDEARQNEFTTDSGDRPLITQFAANNIDDFITAAEMVYPFCDGVDLNCGCPQRWAMQEGFGARMLRYPELISDMISQLRNRLPATFSISVKIRLQPDRRQSVELCRRLQKCGASFVTVHARTPAERKQPADHATLKLLTSACPGLLLVANGDVNSLEIAEHLHQETNCAGVMSARGILRNPALFRGDIVTPLSCVQDWVQMALGSGCSYSCMQHHLEYMLDGQLSVPDKRLLHSLACTPALLHFLQKKYPVNFPLC